MNFHGEVAMTTCDNSHKESNDDAAASYVAASSLSSIDIYLSSALEKTRVVSTRVSRTMVRMHSIPVT